MSWWREDDRARARGRKRRFTQTQGRKHLFVSLLSGSEMLAADCLCDDWEGL